MSASAPATTSRISCVISAWRARFISSVEAVDDLAGVLRGVPHRGHLRALVGGGRLEQRPVDLCLDVHGRQPREDLLGLGLEDEVAAERVVAPLVLVGLEHVGRDRQDLLLCHGLRQRGDEGVVDEHDAVDLALDEQLGRAMRDRLRVGVRGPRR